MSERVKKTVPERYMILVHCDYEFLEDARIWDTARSLDSAREKLERAKKYKYRGVGDKMYIAKIIHEETC